MRIVPAYNFLKFNENRMRMKPGIMKRIFLSAWMIAGFMSLGFSQVKNSSTPKYIPLDANGTYKKFETLIKYIYENYVDSVEEKKLVEKAITSMLEELDPHSIYIPKEEVEEMNMPLKGNFDGIGIRFQILKDTIMVVNTIPGGPSEKLGMRAGDKIIQVNDKVLAGVKVKTSDVRDNLMGPKGTKVNVKVKRKGEPQLIDFLITRDKIPLYSIDAAYMATKDIGYIKLSSFGETSMTEFARAVDSLKKQGMKNLIFDLQGNGGGLLRTAERLCDEFLSGEKLLVYTQGRNYPYNPTYASTPGRFEKGKLVVLVDESSASASEILAGAIQDWDRGVIVGRRSFGKGLVQKPLYLPDGSQVRITTQRYYTPSGRCIQKSYEEGVEEYRKEKYDRYFSGELLSKDSIKIPDSLKFETKINKRVVYGGGGIMPDVFVPIDTTENSDYFSSLIRKGIFNNFCLEYVDKNRNELKKTYPNFDAFNKKFAADKKLTDDLIAYAEKDGVKFDATGFNTSKRVIEVRLKATIAQNLWDYQVFYQVINQLNDSYLKAIETINGTTFKDMKIQSSGEVAKTDK